MKMKSTEEVEGFDCLPAGFFMTVMGPSFAKIGISVGKGTSAGKAAI